ncbi:hypothetical protein U9M48_034792 [Paspalum notatum var. saurae]|uniref:Uncharacterized protein n=1 Tax=Paspalum notatum var. saurae TaxID=547442 RepID=A0AAQ3UB59_PASNO
MLPFLCLSLPRLLLAQEQFADLLFRASKALIHLSALLLMALAGGILLLISTKNSHHHDQDVYRGCDEMLERSLDFSASVTSLLFLGLEGLARVRHAAGHGSDPPSVTYNAGGRKRCTVVVEALNVVLAVATAAVVVLITSVPLGEAAWLLFVPLLLSFVVWMYTALAVDDDGHQLAGHGAAVVAEGEGLCRPPASMELTKVTFTGFLAVSVPTYSDSSISSYTHGFILLTAAAVVLGLGWRLLTHRTAPSRALVTVVPFPAMAANALK